MKDIKRQFTVYQQSMVPVIINGWREIRVTPIRKKTFSYTDDSDREQALLAADYHAVCGYVDTNAESHYAVISESPGRFVHVVKYGSIDGFQRSTLIPREVG